MADVDGYNADILEEQKAKLQELFPEVFTEGKIDFEKLRATLGDIVDKDNERYGLNWKGKLNAFAKIQEKTVSTLHPQPEESVDWDTTQNMFIEGDNLEALKVLHKAYYGKIKMIYIDPPYNTGNDFIYDDDLSNTKRQNWQDEGWKDEEGNIIEHTIRNDGLRVNNGGHKHSNWLDMMYPRLFLARNLLRQDGVIFVSIDDNEVHNLRLMMNEIFGEENFVAQFVWQRRRNADNRNQTRVSTDHEYVLVYSRSQDKMQFLGVRIDTDKYKNPDNDPRGPWASIDLSGLATQSQRPNLHYDIIDPKTGNAFHPNPTRGWSKSKAVVEQMIAEGRVLFPKTSDGRPREKKFLKDLKSTVTGFSTYLPVSLSGNNTEGTREVANIFDNEKVFDFPKPTRLLKNFIWQTTGDDDIILDFFSGSGTLGQAVFEANFGDSKKRKWICIQLPERTEKNSVAENLGYESIADLSRERIQRAGSETSRLLKGPLLEKIGKIDTGFRSYVIGDSNFKKWNELVSDPNEIRQATFDNLDPLEEGTKDEDLLTEILLKHGISSLVEMETHEGFVFIPSESLAISLSRHITEGLFTQILAKSPSQIILLDQAFRDDVNLKANLVLQAEKQNTSVEVL